MRTRVLIASLIAGLVGVAPTWAHRSASTAPAARQLTLTGSYAGRLDILLRQTGFQLVIYGKGRATGLGESVLLGSGPAEQPRAGCWGYQGLASLIGSNGDRIYLSVGQSTACRTTGTVFRNTGPATVMGGTGRFARAKGRLKVTGSGDGVTGAIRFSFTGNVSY